MEKNRLLIFDLDDTIFETRSIDDKQVAPIFDSFQLVADQLYSANEIKSIVDDLWTYPFDYVSHKYQFNDALKEQFSASINSIDYNLEIKTFEDYKLVKTIEARKLLVTTGFRKLQLAKISALGIEQDFQEIHIDEIDSKERQYKKGIFAEVLDTNKSYEIFVIGDNPESELKAGHELGFTTIQVAKLGQEKSKYAKHLIADFKELIEIVRT